ncbi:MAG: hypothetical protein WAV93_04845 [Bacteroidales bacterium]
MEIGPEGGYIDAEDRETGVIFGIIFPEGALAEKTTITLIVYGSPRPGVLGKTHINGFAILPEGLLLLEKASIHVYNPPGDVRDDMLLYHIAGEKFIIPLGSQSIHEDENWIEGTFYSTGRFSLGSPTAAEASAQANKLTAYSPARPLAYGGVESDLPARILPDSPDMYPFPLTGGPFAIPYELNLSITEYNAPDPAECIRWQRALTKVEGHMSWVEHFIYTNNPAAEQAERDKARDALQDAIDDYLNRPSPANRCSSYTRAAAKYTEAATLLGMNIQDEAPVAQHFNNLVNECSYVFSVESREWSGHPREMDLGGMFESRLTSYGTVNCHVPWNEFITTGKQGVQGTGNRHEHFESHWVGDEKESHEEWNNSYTSKRIEGNIKVQEDEFGRLSREAHIKIYWECKRTFHIWGRNTEGNYDETSRETKTVEESKIYSLDPPNNSWSDGNSTAGASYRAFVIKQPGDGRFDPDDCF